MVRWSFGQVSAVRSQERDTGLVKEAKNWSFGQKAKMWSFWSNRHRFGHLFKEVKVRSFGQRGKDFVIWSKRLKSSPGNVNRFRETL